MPIYEYECQFPPCHHRFEAIRSINEPDTVMLECPECAEPAVRDSVPRATHSSKNPNTNGSSIGIKLNWRPF